MDLETLQRLAREGFNGVPGDRLTDLWLWCRDFCEASGDGRYCAISETIRSVDEWRMEHDERGGVPTALLDEIERLLTSLLPAAIGAELASDGAMLARSMREQVQALLIGPAGWRAQGYAS